MKARLKDVAARAGVAVNTASTILNRRPNSWASKETSERVFAAAGELGYKPNRAAVALRSGKFNAIGLLIPDLHNPFYTSFADLIEEEADKRGYDVILESWRVNLAREAHCLHDLLDRQIDGIATFLSDQVVHHDFLSEQFQRRRPIVAIHNTGGEPLPVDCVLTDFSGGLRAAVEALYSRGHRDTRFYARWPKVRTMVGGQSCLGRCWRIRGLLRATSISCAAIIPWRAPTRRRWSFSDGLSGPRR